MADVELFDLDAGRHHRTSVLLHAASAVLCFLFLRGTTGADGPAFVAAGLFAWHPQRVESVAWVAERKDVLAGTFFFLTLLAHARYARAPSVGRYLLVVLALALGLMAKPMLVTVPFLLLVLDVWPLRRTRSDARRAGAPPTPVRRLLWEKAPLVALALASSVVTWNAQSAGGALGSLDALGTATRLQNAAIATCQYLGDALWPSGLAVFYPPPGDRRARGVARPGRGPRAAPAGGPHRARAAGAPRAADAPRWMAVDPGHAGARDRHRAGRRPGARRSLRVPAAARPDHGPGVRRLGAGPAPSGPASAGPGGRARSPSPAPPSSPLARSRCGATRRRSSATPSRSPRRTTSLTTTSAACWATQDAWRKRPSTSPRRSPWCRASPRRGSTWARPGTRASGTTARAWPSRAPSPARPADGDLRYSLGVTLFNLNELLRAEAELVEAVRLEPAHPSAARALEEVRRRL